MSIDSARPRKTYAEVIAFAESERERATRIQSRSEELLTQCVKMAGAVYRGRRTFHFNRERLLAKRAS